MTSKLHVSKSLSCIQYWYNITPCAQNPIEDIRVQTMQFNNPHIQKTSCCYYLLLHCQKLHFNVGYRHIIRFQQQPTEGTKN